MKIMNIHETKKIPKTWPMVSKQVETGHGFLMRVSFHTQSMLLPPDPPSNLEEPIESISSMKMIDGACSLKN